MSMHFLIGGAERSLPPSQKLYPRRVLDLRGAFLDHKTLHESERQVRPFLTPTPQLVEEACALAPRDSKRVTRNIVERISI
jgi:hypothetical protein